MAEENTNIRWDGTPIDKDQIQRDSLVLSKINDNGTIGEMVDTINENFKSIAMHGGGPAGLNGIDGMAGLDGTNVEYIYALSDEMEEGTHFPASSQEKAALFQNVDNSASGKYPYKNLDWYDHAQPISKEHKNEYVMARNRRSESSSWFYSDPVLWAHWGETGMDGDGVEYIFKIYDHELTEDECRAALPSRDDMTREQKAIYNIDDFFPGAGWFVAKNKSKAEKALTNAGIYNSSTFDNLWNRKFDLSLGWTDDPTGTGLGRPYEYVAIRRSNVEEDTDKKEWSDYSIPALWSKYSFEGRIFIIYRNMPADQKPSVDDGTAPKKGDGWWNNKNGADELVFNPASSTGAGRIPEGWTDNNLDHDEGELSWMCSGIFEHTGKNLSWSNPTCISGKDGENGKDGTNIEFIYALSDRMRPDVNYPTTEKSDDSNDHNTMEWLFNTVERDKHKIYNDTTEWFDRAQPISPVDRTEYIWSRRRNSEDEPWDYDPTPILWAHWGEDGTDGDGIEYIFHVSTDESCPTPIRQNQMTGTWGKYQKLFFQLNDFYPGIGWFTKKNKAGRFVNYEKARAAVEAAIERGESGFDINTFEEEWYDGSENYHGSYFGLNQEWTDNPRGVSAETPYEFVSIRRTISDEDAEVTVWDDFSEPVQWSYYGKRTRHFMVYCYVDEGVTPDSPTGGWWNVSTDSLQMAENDTSDFTCAAVDSAHMPENPAAGTYLWMDDDNEVRGKIAWSADGIFIENSHTPKWSKPHRLTGEKGEKGEDGLNVEFIYARDDNPVWPGDGYETFADETAKKAAMKTLFDAVEENGQSTYIVPGDSDLSTIWHDRALEISRNDRIVYCWSRRRDDETSEWEYDDAPFIWAHWGEDGTDGDGIEYIFHISQVNTLSSGSQEKPVKAVTDIQKIIYNFSDFYPGDRWFNNPDNKADVITALSQHDPNLYNSETFETDWVNHFGFNKGSNSWTDNPTDVSATEPYEFVCIRKSYTDTDGTKKWGEFSEPALWGNYGKSTRTFIIYCNMLEEHGEPTEPNTGTGWYNSTGNGSLVMHEQDDPTTPDDETAMSFKIDALTTTQRDELDNNEEKDIIGWWSDTDEDTQLTHTITWISTGTFSESGENLSWSKPHRITGEKGQKGADGSNIEFIYTLSDTMTLGTHYPNKGDLSINWKKMFDLVENPSLADNDNTYHSIGLDVVTDDKGVTCIKYGDTLWYDRARVINNTERIEWAWSRRLPQGANEDGWIYDDAPFVWAHWGEDGTDGDGVEYIFYRLTQPMTITEQQWNSHMVIPGDAGSDYRKVAETIYSMDDFIPNSSWFDKTVSGVQVNKKKVQDKMNANNELPQLFDTYWTNAKNHFSFNNIDIDSNLEGVQSLGNWTDNPLQLDAVNSYQYVSIRKSPDGVWGLFSYPTLWSKYNISKYTEFAFVATTVDADLSSYKPSGGSYESPLPEITYKKDTNNEYTLVVSGIVWGESPNPEGVKTEIWMTCAKVTEGNPTPLDWSFPRRMADTNEFQVEWSETMLTLEQVEDLNTHMANNDDFNFGKILAEPGVNYNHNTAEGKWRERVFNYTNNSAVYSGGVNFGDESANSVLMATCQMKNGVWKDWVVKRVKGEQGEKGDPGRSISVKDRINYEVYLDEKDENDNPITYNYSNAYDALDAAKSSLDPSPSTGNLLIVYPHNPTTNPNSENGIYIGDTTSDDKGGCLYMWKFDSSDWVDYNTPKNPGVTEGNGEDEGNSYVSPNKHLILWDGDTWQDIGELEGPEGKQWILVVKYGKDKEGSVNQKEFTPNQNDPTDAKYIGTFTYLQGTNVTQYLDSANFTATGDQLKVMSGWHWAIFKGQDGYGFEYIFKATSSLNERPDVPDYTDNNGYTTPNYVPYGYGIHNSSVLVEGWEDEPIEPNSTNKRYIWMCWRKYDYTNQRWSDFMGVDNLKYNTGGKARLWQMYANSVSSISEYFHAFDTFSPDFTDDSSTSTQIDTTYWLLKNQVTWNETYKYLFNREVVTYSDGTTTVLNPHLVANYDDGVKDVVDYYCLEKADANGGDTGEVEPKMIRLQDLLGDERRLSKFKNSGNPITATTEIPIIDDIDIYKDDNGTRLFGPDYFTNKTAGKDYWVTNPPKMTEEYPVLWNVTMKLYDDGKWDWTSPIVIGVFGEGQQGADSIYVDLDNEMDSIQVDTDRKTLVERTVSMNLRLYAGEDTLLKMNAINDIDISGESLIFGSETGKISISRTYYVGNTSYNSLPNGGADRVNLSFTIPAGYTLPSDSTKIEITVTSMSNVTRRTSYHLVCTTHPAVYDIIPTATEVLCKNTGTAENPNYSEHTPSSIAITVVERTGSVKQDYSKYNSSQKFRLYYKLNGTGTTNGTWMSSTTAFSVSTTSREPGDYYTFWVAVDANGDGSTYETVLDKETIFCINQGKDGAAGDPGSNGNGYRYYYARYENSKATQYNNSTVCTLSNNAGTIDAPVFKINGVTLPNSPSASGADDTHTYEYRTEKYFDGNTWGSWSDPIIIAKYLTATNISAAVEAAVDSAVANINRDLSNATSAINTLSGYFENGVLKSGSFPSGVLNGYLKTDDLDDEINEIGLGGLMVSANGNMSLFGYLQNREQGLLTTIGTEYLTNEAAIHTYATQTALSNTTTAFQNFKADAHDKFADIEQTVANANYLTNPEGSLLVNIPEYVTWFDTEKHMSWAETNGHVSTDERRNIEWVLCKNVYDSNEDPVYTYAPFKVLDVSTSASVQMAELSKLYDEDTKKKTIFLQLNNVNCSAINSTYINTLKNQLNSGITIAVNLSKGVPTSYSIESNTTGILTSKSGSSVYLSTLMSTAVSPSKANLILYTDVDLTYSSTQSDDSKYIFSSLSWNAGIVSMSTSGTSDMTLAYTKTASIYDDPWFSSVATNPSQDVFDNVTMNSLSANYGYGYTLKKSGSSIVPAETYGKLSIVSPSGYEMKLLPITAAISLTDVVNYLNGDTTSPITAESWLSSAESIKCSTTSTSYYVACSYSSSAVPSDLPFSYAVSLSDKGISNLSNTVTFNGVTLTDENISVAASTVGNQLISYGNCIYIYQSSYVTISDSTVTASLPFAGNVSSQRDVLNVFTIAADHKYTKLSLTFNNATNSDTIYYMIIPALYSASTLNSIYTNASQFITAVGASTYQTLTYTYFETTEEHNANYHFLNNPTFGTDNLPYTASNSKWKNTLTANKTVTVDFTKAYQSGNSYYFTILVRRHINGGVTTGSSINVTMTSSVVSSMDWTTDNRNRSITYPFKNYLIDKITVTILDRSVSDSFDDCKRVATGKPNHNPPTSYIDVIDEERPYLISSVTELATISQHISEGIACVDLIATVKDKNTGEMHSAGAVFQATDDGSSIALMADNIGIKSTHFNLDRDGLTLDGTIYADEFHTNEDNTWIDRDGILHAQGAIISGTVTADKFMAETSISTSVSASDTVITADITKATTITGDQFNIEASGNITVTKTTNGSTSTSNYNVTGNRLYITIYNALKNNYVDPNNISDEIMYGVPVLCMDYKDNTGALHTYVLSPASWVKPGSLTNDTSYIYFKLYGDYYTYTFTVPSGGLQTPYCYVTTSNSLTTYLFRPYDSLHNYSSGGYHGVNSTSTHTPKSEQMYQFTVYDWGDSDGYSDRLTLLKDTYSLLSSSATAPTTTTGFYTTRTKIGSATALIGYNENVIRNITSGMCSDFAACKPTSAIPISSYVRIGHPGLSFLKLDSNYGLSNAVTFMKKLISETFTTAEPNRYKWYTGSTFYTTNETDKYGMITNLSGYLPHDSGNGNVFENNTSTYAVSPSLNQRGDNAYIDLDIYPKFNIAAGGLTLTGISQIYVKGSVVLSSTFYPDTNDYNTMNSSFRILNLQQVNYSGYQLSGNITFIPTVMYFQLDFETVINVTSGTIPGAVLEAFVKNYFESFDWESILTSDYSKYVRFTGYMDGQEVTVYNNRITGLGQLRFNIVQIRPDGF